jgi:hypothetical protein
VSSPGFPSPIAAPSILTTGVTSVVALVKKASAALSASGSEKALS